MTRALVIGDLKVRHADVATIVYVFGSHMGGRPIS